MNRINIPSTQQFRKNLAYQFIYNPYYKEITDVCIRVSKRRRMDDKHDLETAPKFAMKFEGEVDGELKWKKSLKQEYPQRLCATSGCKKRVRTFCTCSPGVWLCKKCHHSHVSEVFTKKITEYTSAAESSMSSVSFSH